MTEHFVLAYFAKNLKEGALNKIRWAGSYRRRAGDTERTRTKGYS
jgi:hypothetical protein